MAKTKGNGVFHRLYVGTGAFDIVGKRKRWYVIFGIILLICIGSIGIKQFNLGIDFVGGTKVQMPAASSQGEIQVQAVKDSFSKALGENATAVQSVGTGGTATIQIR
ncbi:MAG TPA: protein translocase subunit SecF, partial [Umezawaea sp.]|nr:protein translocase subunit SecF [Umezawaea sp.]